ncbi:MAG: patatin-like phospholipase family protein [Acidobacteriota bacterium]
MTDGYSPDRRTALVLTGTGADGAYHAGVLRALDEAGIKIDLVCGRGMGAVSAVFAAIEGAQGLWDVKGLWRQPGVAHLYRWRWPIRVVFVLLVMLAMVLLSPLVFVAGAVVTYPVGMLFGMAGLESGARLLQQYSDTLASAFHPAALPTWLPRILSLITVAGILTLVAGSAIAWRRAPLRRRSRGPLAWAVLGAPLDGSGAARHFSKGLWDLMKGGAMLRQPVAADLSRRVSELLADNLGQPGFRELLLTVHDLDARRDLVFGLVREPFRRTLFPPPSATGVRRAEAFDLAGLAQDHVVDVMRAALSVPGLTEPALVGFSADSYWRGEVHRLLDRPAALSRLLEEAAAAGAEQLIVVSAAPEPPRPHELAQPRLDPLGRLSQHAASLEAASVRDAVNHLQHRFRAVYEIHPGYNPVGAFDLVGAYDERSDREHPLAEQIQRGYEDAYRDFIDPVVAASGEHLQAAPSET